MHFDESSLEKLLSLVLFILIIYLVLIFFAIYRYQKDKEFKSEKE